MWTQATALLLACCLWPSETQNIWNEPIQFNTKAKEKCTMIITGQGEYTKLRLSCQGTKSSYWCDYIGKPHTCRPYNKNPRHFFVQMSWTLRKLFNACQGPKEIQPFMCRKATDESQMVFSSASFARTEASTRMAPRPAVQPARPPPPPTRPNAARQPPSKTIRVPQRPKTTQRPRTQPTTPPNESTPKRMARQYCWRSLQGICSYFIGLFRS